LEVAASCRHFQPQLHKFSENGGQDAFRPSFGAGWKLALHLETFSGIPFSELKNQII